MKKNPSTQRHDSIPPPGPYKEMLLVICGLGSVVFNLSLTNSVNVGIGHTRGCVLSLTASAAQSSMTALADLKSVHNQHPPPSPQVIKN